MSLCNCNQGRTACTCKTNVVPGASFSTTSWATALRYSLIKLLTGQAVVILNADIRLRDATPEELSRAVSVTLQAKNGVLLHGSDLATVPGKVICLQDTHTSRSLEQAR